jgi:protein-L-isoaspartate(D-aspartate) O-methyltransferase
LPEALRSIAYVDEDIDLGGGRVLMAPMVLARLLQAADVRPADIALDIGCATGYSTAVLARLCDTVVGIEPDPEMAAAAGNVLADAGVDNAAVIEAPLAGGYAKQAPYDVIIFGGAIDAVPDAIVGQLADDGRLVAVIADGTGVGRATLMARSGPESLSGRPLFDASTAMLPGVLRRPEFVF